MAAPKRLFGLSMRSWIEAAIFGVLTYAVFSKAGRESIAGILVEWLTEQPNLAGGLILIFAGVGFWLLLSTLARVALIVLKSDLGLTEQRRPPQ